MSAGSQAVPNRLFDVYNSRGRRGWIAAASAERAVELAFLNGWARRRENLSAIESPEAVRLDGSARRRRGWDALESGPEGAVSLRLGAWPGGAWSVLPFTETGGSAS